VTVGEWYNVGMSYRARWFILGFALLGLGFALSSAWVHYRLLTDASYISPCDLNSTFNCSQVYLSRFGAVAGIPVALGGVLWFAFVALLAGFARPGDPRDASGGYVFAASLVGLAVVFYLGYASFYLLRTGCLLCIGTYVCVIGILIASALSATAPMTRLPLRVFSDLRRVFANPTTFVVALLYLAGAASVVAYFPKENTRPQAAQQAAPATADVRQNFTDAWNKLPRIDLGIPTEGAKVLVVKFNDYECGSCRAAYELYKPVYAKFEQSMPGVVRALSKDWPWNATCNFNAAQTIPGHEGACAAAVAARLARDRGKFAEMEAWLFANLPTTAAGIREQVARTLGITDFDGEYARKLPDVKRDIADGGALNIQATPTYFINGVRIPVNNLLPPEYFELAIQLELAKVTK
jgi:uncharacterized membrane protein/protein-disulfide isomerase